jgi:uncharacterized protein (DUF58 family)
MAILLDPEYLRKLENLNLIVHGRFHGFMTGKRMTPRSGMSLEFAEYKEYYPGDDLRYVDWNLYGRLGKLFIKSFTREEDLPVYIFLDMSQSMAIGEKLHYAVQLAGSIAYVGLKEFNRLGVFPFASTLTRGIAPRSGHRQIFQVFRFLSEIEPAGETSINESLTRFIRIRRESGLAIIISDMLSEDGFEEGLAQLLYHGYEVVVLHVLSPQDTDPEFTGELKLRDVENRSEMPIYIDGPSRRQYLQALSEYNERVESFCRERNMRYCAVSTGDSLEESLFESLREGALIQ